MRRRQEHRRAARLIAVLLALAGCTGGGPLAVRPGSTTLSSVPPPPPTTAAGVATTVARPPTAPSSTSVSVAAPSTTVRAGAGGTASTGPARPGSSTTVGVGPGCPSTLASQLATTGGGSQVMTVEAPAAGSTSATVTLWQRAGTCWTGAGGPWPARVGYNGLSGHHHEGDGTTPIGVYGISSAFYGNAADPGVHGSYHQLACGDWWDEDPTSAHYNTFQHVACNVTPPFGGQSEALWQTVAYRHFAVVEYNTGPIVAGAGSGIFIHDDGGGGTNGCVSLPPGSLDTLLRWLQPAQSPHIVIGTSGGIRGL